MKLEKNVGTVDKIFRFILSAALITLGAIFIQTQFVLSILLFVIAVVIIITALMSFCSIYTLFGINTCKRNSK